MLRIKNKDIRKLWLTSMGLASPASGKPDVLNIIKKLGFVQIDTIQNVSRAHHHILWSRNRNYREYMLDDLLKPKGDIFEHFTHDASLIPVEYYPYWTRQFERLRKRFDNYKNYQKILAHADLELIKKKLEEKGALSTESFDTKIKGKKKMWSRPPHKVGLDYLWYAGELATSHRINFRKFYDLKHRVIEKNYLDKNHSDEDQIDWLCKNAIGRLSFGTLKEIREFWDACDRNEVENWYKHNNTNLKKIEYQNHNGERTEAIAPVDIEERLGNLSPLSDRISIINPFDPAIRDRARLKNIFGFDYKIEIFVPAAKRKWGYYVYPLLEGDKFVGRIELKADRKNNTLNVVNLWEEPGIKWGARRKKKLETELRRFSQLSNMENIKFTGQL